MALRGGFAGGFAGGIQHVLEQPVQRCKGHALLVLDAGGHDNPGRNGHPIPREDPRWAVPVADVLGLGGVADTGGQPDESDARLVVEAGRGRCSLMPSRTAEGRPRPPSPRRVRCNRNCRRCIRLHCRKLIVLTKLGGGWSQKP